MQFKKPQSNYPEIKDIDLDEFQRLSQEANDKELAWAKIAQELSALECTKKERFATICSIYYTNCKSNAETERAALRDAQWSDFLRGFKEIQSKEILAKAEKNVAVRNWESARTVISLKKQELNRL